MNSAAFDSLGDLRDVLRVFAEKRDWPRYHSPKNLAMALAGEVGEVMEHFQWLTEAESLDLPEATRHAVGLELADVLFYLVRLADRSGVDLAAAAAEKLALNEIRFPPVAPDSSAVEGV